MFVLDPSKTHWMYVYLSFVSALMLDSGQAGRMVPNVLVKALLQSRKCLRR